MTYKTTKHSGICPSSDSHPFTAAAHESHNWKVLSTAARLRHFRQALLKSIAQIRIRAWCPEQHCSHTSTINSVISGCVKNIRSALCNGFSVQAWLPPHAAASCLDTTAGGHGVPVCGAVCNRCELGTRLLVLTVTVLPVQASYMYRMCSGPKHCNVCLARSEVC